MAPTNNNHTSIFTLCFALIFYAFLAGIIIGANPFHEETSAPMDLLSKFPGWSSHSFSENITHPERSDIVDCYIPKMIFLKNRIDDKKGLLWNSVVKEPNLFNFSNNLLSLPNIIFLLFDQDWQGYYFYGLSKLVIAALGTFLFLRLYLSTPSSLIGGAVFAFCGFNAAWFYWPQVTTSAWIPWVLWGTAGWFIYKERKWLICIILATINLILGGFPAVSAWGVETACLFVMFYLLTHRNISEIKKLFFFLASILISFLFTAIPLLALKEQLDFIDIGYRAGGTPLQFPKDILLFFNAWFNGLPRVEKTYYCGKIIFLYAATVPFFFAFSKLFRKRTGFLTVFAFFLFLCSILFAFGLLPHTIIRTIPPFGNNPWSRFTVIADFSIAILGSIGIECVFQIINRFKNKKITVFAMLILIFIPAIRQFQEQQALFRTFNNIAVKKDFFPATPSINYVLSHITPSQSVIADNTFIVSGTLGNYAIPEQFAHGFKNNSEKKMLSQIAPFTTKTAAFFDAKQIIFNAELFAKLGIKYVLIRSNAGINLKENDWILHKEIEKSIIVIENKITPKGAYWVKNLTDDSPWNEDKIITNRLHTDTINVQYKENIPGYIVYPERYYPGWEVYVNGKRTKLQKYLNRLQAVRVDGSSEVCFTYKPDYLKKGLFFMLIGLFCFIYLYFKAKLFCENRSLLS